MLTMKRVLFAVALVGFATGAEAQTITTYIGGPKSGFNQSANVGGAHAIGVDNEYLSYAQTVPVRQRVAPPANGVSAGVQAIGADSAYGPTPRQRVLRAAPARRSGASGPTSGAKAIGSDN